jgi:hypothetical protein
MTNRVKKPPLSAVVEEFLAKGRGEIPSPDGTGDYAVEWARSVHNREVALNRNRELQEEVQRLARDKRQARPNETITAIAGEIHREIHRAFGAEVDFPVYSTVYLWVSKVAPPAVRKPGRPPKK